MEREKNNVKMMKALVLFLVVFSSLFFAQQKTNNIQKKNDSLAVQNVDVIIQKSKDSYSLSNKNTQTHSDIQKNTNQLLRNDLNYNAAIKPRFTAPANQGFLNNSTPQPVNGLGRTKMSVPIYKSK